MNELGKTFLITVSQVDRVNGSERSALFFYLWIHCKEGSTHFLPDSDDIAIDEETECNGDSEFMSLVSRGKLVFPSTELFTFALFTDAIFKNLELVTCSAKALLEQSLVETWTNFSTSYHMYVRKTCDMVFDKPCHGLRLE